MDDGGVKDNVSKKDEGDGKLISRTREETVTPDKKRKGEEINKDQTPVRIL